MAKQLSQSKAIAAAEKQAAIWYKKNESKITAAMGNPPVAYKSVHNCGTDDYVMSDIEKSVTDTWKAKSDFKGLERRASMSSGEPKIDLKLAIPNQSAASFNFHVVVQSADEQAAEAAKKQSKEDKKIAAAFKVEKDKEDADIAEKIAALEAQRKENEKKLAKQKQAAATAWNKLSSKVQKASDKDTWILAYIAKMK